MSSDGDDFDPNEPIPQSSYFGNNEDEEDGDPDDLNAALEGFDADADYDVLPDFANQQNKALDIQVKAKEKKVVSLAEEVAENTERVGIMADHLKNVEQEHVHTQSLIDAKHREVETEDHLRALSEREVGRIRVDVKKADKGVLDFQDQLNMIQNEMFAANEKLEQFKLQMNWNQEELLQWSLAAKQKDEDRSALEKYEQLDSIKIKNLALKMEKMARQVQLKKAELDDEVTESQAVQIELDKISEEYRKVHTQRQDLVQQWDEAINALMKRDQAIAAQGVLIADVKREVRERQRILAEEKEFFASEEGNNKQLVVNTGGADRMCEKKRTEMQEMKRELVDFDDEVTTQRGEVEKAEGELRALQTMIESLKVLKVEKIQRIEDYKPQLEQTKVKLESEFATTDDLAERSKQVELLNEQQEERLAQMTKGLQTMKETMFVHQAELFKLRKEEADLIAEISGSQGTSRNLQSRIHDLDQRSLNQQEMLYNIEFKVQQMQRKVARASGKRSVEETTELTDEINKLQEVLDLTASQHTMIANQCKRLHDDVRKGKFKYRQVCEERDKLLQKNADVEIENESANREVNMTAKKKEETIVSHDVLKLEVKRLRDILTAKADDVLQLENRKLQLELSMKEREKEVSLHQDVQRAEAKSAEESRHKLNMDLKERQIKVEKLKSKYEVVAARMPGADDGEEHSQAYFIIAAAQKREELQREGDELNRSIRRAEKEIRMLTKTLHHLTGLNQNYRGSFQKANMSGPEAKLKRDLEEQHRSVSDNLYKQKAYLREITTDFAERTRILGELDERSNELKVEVQQKELEVREIVEKMSSHEEQVQRANQQMLAKRDEYREVKGIRDGETSVVDTHVALLERKRKNRVLLNLLRNFAEDNPHMLDAVTDTLEGVGLKLASNRPASAASSQGYRRPGSAYSRPGSGIRRPGSRGVELPDVRASSRGSSRPSSRGIL